jgi:RNA polymerase II subunit A C-terminal domain phosphatase SSU72
MNVRDTSEAYLASFNILTELNLFFQYVQSGLGHMDPRRARDPRLARADPRQPSRTPPTQPSNQENGASNHGTPQPQPQLANAQPWDGEQSNPTPPTPPTPAQKQSPSVHKPRPLFCVVCASNQVRSGHHFCLVSGS